MTTSSPAEIRIQAPLSALSIDDYEVLVAPREAFVQFLIGPHLAFDRAGVAGSSSVA